MQSQQRIDSVETCRYVNLLPSWFMEDNSYAIPSAWRCKSGCSGWMLATFCEACSQRRLVRYQPKAAAFRTSSMRSTSSESTCRIVSVNIVQRSLKFWIANHLMTRHPVIRIAVVHLKLYYIPLRYKMNGFLVPGDIELALASRSARLVFSVCDTKLSSCSSVGQNF